MRNTRYRERFANGGLKKELDRLENSIGLYMLVADYKEISHEESRIFSVPFYKLIYDEPDIERKILKILKEESVSLNILCGLGFGLLNLK